MGTCCAASYANLYPEKWEPFFLLSENVFKYWTCIMTSLRYIDDIFLVWDGPVDPLLKFLTTMNVNPYNLTFIMSYDCHKVTILDVSVEVDDNGTIKSNLYRKPMAENTILQAQSLHPRPLIQSIPYSKHLQPNHAYGKGLIG